LARHGHQQASVLDAGGHGARVLGGEVIGEGRHEQLWQALGTLVPAGTPVLAGYSAAGRDPAAHGPDADRFDLTRSARPGAVRHLSLGHGAHYCLGAPLARLEATVALERLFTRFPSLRLAVPEADLVPHAGFVGNSVRGLPVRLAAG
ncbi:cytochrome P450, partial [Streptomyces olivaceoviridis]